MYAIARALPPCLHVAICRAFHAFRQLHPYVSTVLTSKDRNIFPRTCRATIKRNVIAVHFMFFIWEGRQIVTINFLRPLRAMTKVVRGLLANFCGLLIFAPFGVEVENVLFVRHVIVVGRVGKTRKAILFGFTGCATCSIPIVQVVFLIRHRTVISRNCRSTTL